MPRQETALDAFPRIYRGLLPEAFSRPVPAEELATCSNCAMCAKPDDSDAGRGLRYFKPSLKCCTYHPTLANFLVGGALLDESDSMQEGRHRLRERIAARIDCRPVGLAVPELYAHQYRNKGSDVFGRSEAMLCPYFDSTASNCSIWRYRDSTCSTWFCKHVKGEDGRDFWMAAKAYVAHLEHVLSSHLALQLGLRTKSAPANARAAKLSSGALDGCLDERRHAAEWGEWNGKEAAFYIECHRLAEALSREDVVRIIGEFHDRTLGAPVEALHRQMVTPELPARLLRNPRLSVFPSEAGQLLVHSPAGGFSLSKELLNVLWVFDGALGTTEAREQLRKQHGVDFSDGLLAKLYHNRILVESEPA